MSVAPESGAPSEPAVPAGRKLFWAVSGGVAGALVLFYLFEPTAGSLFPRCAVNAVTGFYCAGCGTQRALHQLLHGNLSAAFGLNALMVLILPLVIYAWAAQALATTGRSWLPALRFNRFIAWSALVVVLLFWGLRNLPWWPFYLLAP